MKAMFDEKNDRRFLAPVAAGSGMKGAMVDPGWTWEHPGGFTRFEGSYYRR
jgi:hypothetical protein